MADLKVVELNASNFKDPVASLRKIADEIEAGDYGGVNTVVVAVFGDTLEVFGAGEDSEGPTVALVLHAAFARISNAIADHGRE